MKDAGDVVHSPVSGDELPDAAEVGSAKARRRARNAEFDFEGLPRNEHKRTDSVNLLMQESERSGAELQDIEGSSVSPPAEKIESAAALLAQMALTRADYAKRSASITRDDEMERRRQRKNRMRDRSPNPPAAEAK